MARHEVFLLSERKDVEHDEERAGLLEDAVRSEDSSEPTEAEEREWKSDGDIPIESTARRIGRYWLR